MIRSMTRCWRYVGCCRVDWVVRGERNGGDWQQKRQTKKEMNLVLLKRNLPLVNFMSIPIAFVRQKLLLFNQKIFSFYWLGNKESFLPVTDISKYIQGSGLSTSQSKILTHSHFNQQKISKRRELCCSSPSSPSTLPSLLIIKFNELSVRAVTLLYC